MIASLAVERLISVVLIIAGGAIIINAFEARRAKGLTLSLFGGLLYLLGGIVLLAFPLQGVLTLTALLTILFIVGGFGKVALAFSLRPLANWRWLAFGGLLSVFLGILIWTGLPGTAIWAIGLLVGIELYGTGHGDPGLVGPD